MGGTTTPLKTSKRIKVSALCNQCSCYAEIKLDRGYLTWMSNIKFNTDCTVCLGLQASNDVTFTSANLNGRTFIHAWAQIFVVMHR